MNELADISQANPIKVMVVDDSAVVRGLVTKMLEKDPLVQVIASVGNGDLAVKRAQKRDVEVVILDIEMPVMDGLTALPKLLEVDPEVKIVVASTLTKRNSKTSIRALTAGAVDYIPKPSSSREIGDGGESEDRKSQPVAKRGRQQQEGDNHRDGENARKGQNVRQLRQHDGCPYRG